ncbi:MAG TPA: hypothetical protein VF795_11025 [Desulfuromonadaceae bacterium]
MHITVSKTTDLRFVSFIIVASLLVGSAAAQAAGPEQGKNGAPAAAAAPRPRSGQAATAAPAPAAEWGAYLDVAYELTYWDRGEIRQWREKSEREIGETLAGYTEQLQGRLGDSPGKGGSGEQASRPHAERDYLRLAIARTVDYLQSGNGESLAAASQTLEKLKDKATMPEIAYWTGYVRALQALETQDPARFVGRVFDIWNSAVLYREQGDMAAGPARAAEDAVTPYYYRNIITLVVNRAISERKVGGLDALGPLFLMMKGRNMGEKDGEGAYFATLVQRIAEGLQAPDSDRCRLNFTVAMIESKRLEQVAVAKLDNEGMSEAARTAFEQARLFNDYALRWAASRRSSGVVTAVAQYLDLSSFAIQRLPDNEKAPAYAWFASLPAQDGSLALLKAMAVFNDVALYADGGWEKAGYADRDACLKAMHRLWRAIMELSLWTGDFYARKLDAANDPQSVYAAAAPMQASLDSYLDFLMSQKSRGFSAVIPDSAYYGGAEAAGRLASAYRKLQAYSSDTISYNLWFLHGLQAAELFPLDPREIAGTAAVLRHDGRYNLYLDYYLPLAARFKESPAVREWLAAQKPEAANVVREYVNAIDQFFAGDSAGKAGGTDRGALVASLRQLREELQRKPDHPVHKLLRAFYTEEMEKNTPYTALLKGNASLNR